MIKSLDVSTWKALRLVLRGKNRPVLGAALRVDMSRRTKDGKFLDRLLAAGLLEVVAPAPVHEPRHSGDRPKPEPLRRTYRLTDAGKRAADFGEYEVPDPFPIPVRETS